MIGITIALYEEALPFLSQLTITKKNGISYYTGFIKNKPVSLLLVSPRIPKPSKVKRWLELHTFDIIINIGLVGALQESLALGSVFWITNVTTHIPHKKSPLLQSIDLSTNSVAPMLTSNGYKQAQLYSATKPIIDAEDKYELYTSTKATVVDMELYKLVAILKEANFDLNQFISIKITGDEFTDSKYLQKEIMFRSYFQKKSIFDKIDVIIKVGMVSFIKIYRRKKYLQNKIYTTFYEII